MAKITYTERLDLKLTKELKDNLKKASYLSGNKSMADIINLLLPEPLTKYIEELESK